MKRFRSIEQEKGTNTYVTYKPSCITKIHLTYITLDQQLPPNVRVKIFCVDDRNRYVTILCCITAIRPVLGTLELSKLNTPSNNQPTNQTMSRDFVLTPSTGKSLAILQIIPRTHTYTHTHTHTHPSTHIHGDLVSSLGQSRQLACDISVIHRWNFLVIQELARMMSECVIHT